jgi:peptidoglycan/xylan/chitin deacetylase (PgdA/CDA1 family)
MTCDVKSAIKQVLLRAGYYHHRLKRDAFESAVVLCYHSLRSNSGANQDLCFHGLHVTVQEFESHCKLLKETCYPISLDQLMGSLNGGQPLPPRPVLVTFDDGYRTFLTLAHPILRKYEIPAILFVCSEPVEKQELLWYDAVARSLGDENITPPSELPYGVWREKCAKLSRPIAKHDPHAPLTVQEIKALAAMPGIEIGGHTASHARLAKANRNEQFQEVLRNKRSLEEWIGRTVRAFAYPNGLPEKDYNSDSVSVVKDAGYELAFTTAQGYAKADQQLEIPRFVMLAGLSRAELGHRLAHSWPSYSSSRRAALSITE